MAVQSAMEASLAPAQVVNILEAALMVAEGPLTSDQLFRLFMPGELDAEQGRSQIKEALTELANAYAERGVELIRVASGYRFQARQDYSPWVSRLWEEKPPRYTRALLETLAIIAYKQPVTRGDIEQIRGVGVSQNIMRTLLEREWIRAVGQKEVPGRPSIYGTTKEFLDYFSLSKLSELPPLDEIKALAEPLPTLPEPTADRSETAPSGDNAATAETDALSDEAGSVPAISDDVSDDADYVVADVSDDDAADEIDLEASLAVLSQEAAALNLQAKHVAAPAEEEVAEVVASKETVDPADREGTAAFFASDATDASDAGAAEVSNDCVSEEEAIVPDNAAPEDNA